MTEKRVPLYERLPEIYRIRDLEQAPPGQLKQYLEMVEEIFGEIHKNIESLYHDLFIETCDDWVIPYIGDLLGASHLKGNSWTLRADVADTIALRRRKGTLAGIERLTFNLTRWGVHCAELRENLVSNQHLNHQRPDKGVDPPYSLPSITRFTPIRGGTVPLRDPATLSLLDTPFDPFAHIADVKPPILGDIRYNLPNLAIFLWRLQDYTIKVSKPVFRGITEAGVFIVRIDIDPLGRPVRLFNTYQFDPDLEPPIATQLDETPSPIPTARLSQNCEAGEPEKYFAIDTYRPGDFDLDALDIADVGLQIHIPVDEGSDYQDWPTDEESLWTISGANLCAWEEGLSDSVRNGDVVIDPVIGRVLIGVDSAEKAAALEENLLVTYTYGAVGPVGAHPISRIETPPPWDADSIEIRHVNFFSGPESTLSHALDGLNELTSPVVIEIADSMVHVLDLDDPPIKGTIDEDGPTLQLNQPLLIRAADGQRPIIQLRRSLRFRPVNAAEADDLTVRLEGIYLTRETSYTGPLISRAALNKLEIINCTLDPGGYRVLDGSHEGDRAPVYTSLFLQEPYGFSTDPDEEVAFDQTPEIVVQKSITGPLLIDSGYSLFLKDSIIDSGKSANGADDAPVIYYASDDDYVEKLHYAVTAASDINNDWGPPTHIENITAFGRMRVECVNGDNNVWTGGIWIGTLEVLSNQKGCIKFSYFSGNNDRLPENHACVTANGARLHLVSDVFGDPAYGQIAHTSNFRIREHGPGDDLMGAFGFLLEAHKWRNLQIRFREFMPVGIRPLLIPVT